MIALRSIAVSICALILGACATQKPYDYTNFKAHMPKSIIVLPPTNTSVEVEAPYSVYSLTSRPIAESGYYIFSPSLVDETFKENGLQTSDDIHQLPLRKIRDVFGADAVLYLNVKEYGTQYSIIGSASIVTVEAKLVDLASGILLWQGQASASSEEGQSNQGGLVLLLLQAVVKQVIGTVTNQSHEIARITNNRLLSAAAPNGILFGPRSPNHTPE